MRRRWLDAEGPGGGGRAAAAAGEALLLVLLHHQLLLLLLPLALVWAVLQARLEWVPLGRQLHDPASEIRLQYIAEHIPVHSTVGPAQVAIG